MNNGFLPRIGTFCLLLGIGSLILFAASGFGRRPEYLLLLTGMVLTGIWGLLRRRAIPPPPSNRFSGARKILSKAKARSTKKEEPKKK